MLRNLSKNHQPEAAQEAARSGADQRLQAILWTIWTLVVVGTGIFQWRAGVADGRPIDMVGIVVYALLAGTIGLVVMTMIEIWLEPQRFVD